MNNAGVITNSLFQMTSLKSLRNIFEINFDDTFWQKEIVDNISLFVDDFYEFLSNKKRKVDLLRNNPSLN